MSDITTLMMAAAGAGGETDGDFASTVLLLHGDGTNGAQNNTFLDSSTNNFTITRNGNVTQGSVSPFGRTSGNLDNAYDPAVNGGSAYFDGTGDYLTVPDNAAFDFNAAFTIEGWLYLNAYTNVALIDTRSTSSDGYTLALTTGELQFVRAGTQVLITTAKITLNSWTHFVVVRDASNNVSLFLNGSRDGTTTNSSTFTSATTVHIGAKSLGASSLVPVNGYVSSLRIVKATAVYDPTQTTLTVPTAPLTAIANTSLLLSATNAGIFDNTGKNNLETVGNAQIDTTTKKYGTGAMEFDGTGDWLIVPNSPDNQLGTGNFTIEFWVYLNATGAARGFVGKGGASTGWLVSLVSTNTVRFTYASSTITSTGTLSASTWYHIAVVREGTGSNQTKIYINGTNDGTGTVSTDFNQTEVMYIGANRTGGDALNGYIDDLRITKGVARYTTNFTPPTKAFPDL